MMDYRKFFFVNYEYRRNSSGNFIKFDSIEFEIYSVFKKMTKKCLSQ